jgi:hypothetical protein
VPTILFNDLARTAVLLYFRLPKLRPENPVRAAFRWSGEW